MSVTTTNGYLCKNDRFLPFLLLTVNEDADSKKIHYKVIIHSDKFSKFSCIQSFFVQLL